MSLFTKNSVTEHKTKPSFCDVRRLGQAGQYRQYVKKVLMSSGSIQTETVHLPGPRRHGVVLDQRLRTDGRFFTLLVEDAHCVLTLLILGGKTVTPPREHICIYQVAHSLSSYMFSLRSASRGMFAGTALEAIRLSAALLSSIVGAGDSIVSGLM